MAKTFSPALSRQNAAFLRHLATHGSIKLAAEAIGRAPATLHERRRACPVFAQRWAAAVATASARLTERRGQLAKGDARVADPRRTVGGELVVTRGRGGRLQVRRSHPGRLTRHAQQQFLAALSATCNIRLSAAAAGTTKDAIRRLAQRDPAFAREMRLAREMGYRRVEEALLAGFEPEAHEHGEWRDNDPPAVPPMTAAQALQLLYLHQKEALIGEPEWVRRRRGEPEEVYRLRLTAVHEARQERARERFRIAEAERRARGCPSWPPEPGHPDYSGAGLPDLAQVTGWSEADPSKAPHDPDRALFGGWRQNNLSPEQVELARRRRSGRE